MDAECARMNCEERATVLMAYDPRNARAWLRDLTDAHPSLGLSLCSWHAASTSVPMGWECIDERRGMRFGLDDIDDPEPGFLFTEEPISPRRLLSEPTAERVTPSPDSPSVAYLLDNEPVSPIEPSPPEVELAGEAASTEPYVTRFDDRGRFGDEATNHPSDAHLSDAPRADDLVADVVQPEPQSAGEGGGPDAGFAMPEPEPIRILDRESSRSPSVSYFDDDGYSEPIAIPLDEIDGIELGFEPLMPGDELDDLKLEAAERFTTIEPVPEEEFEDFEPVPEPMVPSDSVVPLTLTELAIDAAYDAGVDGEYLLPPETDGDFETHADDAVPHLVAVDPSAGSPDADTDLDALVDSAIDTAMVNAVDRATDRAIDVAADVESDGGPESDPPGFAAEFLVAEAADNSPIWADDEIPWQTEPEPPETGTGEPSALTASTGTASTGSDESFELPRLFDDIGYAQIDDDDDDDADASSQPVDDEDIDPSDELSFDDIFPSMVNRRPATNRLPDPNSAQDHPQATTAPQQQQQQAQSIDAPVPDLSERRSSTTRSPQQARPPVARSYPEPSFVQRD